MMKTAVSLLATLCAVHISLAQIQMGEVYDENLVQPNQVDFSMGYSGNTTWTTGIGQTLGAQQIVDVETFSAMVANAFAQGRGGVIDFDGVPPGSYHEMQSFDVSFAGGTKQLTLSNRIGGSYSISGPLGDRTAISGDQFLGTGGNPHFDFEFTNFTGFGANEKIVAVGVTILGRSGQGTGRNFRVVARYTNGEETGSSSTFRGFDMQNGNGTQDSFSGILAPEGYWITSIRVHSDHGVYTGMDDLAFITTDLGLVIQELDLPVTVDFGSGTGQNRGTILLRNPVGDFEVEGNVLAYAPESSSFAPAAAMAKVTNLRPMEDFRISADVLMIEAPRTAGHAVGLAALGELTEEAPYFDPAAGSSYYGLVWVPSVSGSASTLEIREGFAGPALVSVPWTGSSDFATPLEVVLSEDFESGADGWLIGGTPDDLWEIGVPTTGPSSAHGGQNVAGTGLATKYGNDVSAWLRTPAIDLSSALAAEVGFWEYTDIDDFGTGEFHYAKVSVVDASSGAELVELARYNDQSLSWRQRTHTLPSSVLGQIVRIEFRLISDDEEGNVYDGWYLDDVEVRVSEAARYRFVAEGGYRDNGDLAVAFSVATSGGHSQAVSTTIQDPLDGSLFGFGGISRIDGGVAPVFGLDTLGMEAAPYTLAFGSSPDNGTPRSSGVSFQRTVAADWSLTEESLRLQPTQAEYYESLAVQRIRYFESGDAMYLRMPFTLLSHTADVSDNAFGMVLFGADDPEVFATDGEGYVSVQWIPGNAGGSLMIRYRMNGEVIDSVDFADLKRPPVTVAGESYDFRFLAYHDENGGFTYHVSLIDSHGGEASLSGLTMEAPMGTRFGFGALHRASDGPVWDIHGFEWSDERPLGMPLDYHFGTAPGRDGHADFAKSGFALGGWSLLESALVHRRADSGTEVDGALSRGTAEVFYVPGQDFALRSRLSTSLMPAAPGALAFTPSSTAHPNDQVEVPTTGLTPEEGTVEISFQIRSPMEAGHFSSHVSPRNNFSNRIYVNYNPDGGLSFRLGGSPMVLAGIMPEPGRWYRATLTWNNGEGRGYLDGQMVASFDYTGLTQVSDIFEFGNIGHLTRNEYAPSALLRDGALWSRALSEEEVASFHANGLTGAESGLVGYWPLNEGEGSVANDFSPNANHGTISGARWLSPAPRLGVTFLGSLTNGVYDGFSLHWDPDADGGPGFLRLEGPGGAPVLASMDLAGVAGAPRLETGMVYTFEVEGIHQPDGSLDITGSLSDNGGAEASVTVSLDETASWPRGSRFGMSGRHAAIHWQTFQMGTPAQLDGLDPTLPEGTTFELWQQLVFTAEELLDPNVSGLLAAPAGDGISNLLKYAFGLLPFEPAVLSDRIELEIEQGILRLIYWERSDARDLVYTPQISISLDGWTSEGIVEVGREVFGNYHEVTVEASLPADSARGFIRVNVRQD